MCPSAPRVCSEPGGQKPALSLSLDRIAMTFQSTQNNIHRVLHKLADAADGGLTGDFRLVRPHWRLYTTITIYWDHLLLHPRIIDDVIKWKHFPRYWPFVRGIHRSPVNSPHKGQWRGALMFSLICIWINGWVNNRKAGDLRRYHAHYDVIVMLDPNGMELNTAFTYT